MEKNKIQSEPQEALRLKTLNIDGAPFASRFHTHPSNHSQEWAKQRWTFLEEKHGLSLFTGKRKPNVSQVELREEVPIGVIKLSEMTDTDTESVDKPTNCPQEEYPRATSSKIWDETHLLRLMVSKGKADQVDLVSKCVGVVSCGIGGLVVAHVDRRSSDKRAKIRSLFEVEVVSAASSSPFVLTDNYVHRVY